MSNRPLTDKEQRIITALEQTHPSAKEIVQSNLFNPNSDWAETIACADESEIVTLIASWMQGAWIVR